MAIAGRSAASSPITTHPAWSLHDHYGPIDCSSVRGPSRRNSAGVDEVAAECHFGWTAIDAQDDPMPMDEAERVDNAIQTQSWAHPALEDVVTYLDLLT